MEPSRDPGRGAIDGAVEVGQRDAESTVAPFLGGLADFVSFPEVTDVEMHARVVDVVRVATGLVVVWRLGMIFESARFFYGPTDAFLSLDVPQVRILAVQLILAWLLLIGMATRIALIAMLLTFLRMDAELSTRTLGSQVLVTLLAVLLLCGAGEKFSVDAVLRRSKSLWLLGRVLDPLRPLLGAPDGAQRRVYLLLGFTGYWVLSLGGILFHVQDPYWLSGDTVSVMLENSYFSRVYVPARFLEEHVPAAMMFISVLAIVGQTIFQFGMLTLLRWKWTHQFVIWWGLGFFVLSLIGLQLSYLPHLELCLWALLFLRLDGAKFNSFASLRLPQNRAVASEPVHPVGPQPRWVSSGTVGAGLAMCCVAVLSFQTVNDRLESAVGVNLRAEFPGVATRADVWVKWAGLVPPNVFNQDDLRKGDSWAVIWSVDDSGARRRVPFYADDGHRLWYHLSDSIYYGMSLPMRQGMVGQDLVQIHQPGELGHARILEILNYDRRRNSGASITRYDVEIYDSHTSDTSVAADKRFDATVVYRFAVAIDELFE